MRKPTTQHYCATCDEWDYEYVCHVCGDSMTPPADRNPRDKGDDDGVEYAHPGDRLRGLE